VWAGLYNSITVTTICLKSQRRASDANKQLAYLAVHLQVNCKRRCECGKRVPVAGSSSPKEQPKERERVAVVLAWDGGLLYKFMLFDLVCCQA
jgi:hypothetical protein